MSQMGLNFIEKFNVNIATGACKVLSSIKDASDKQKARSLGFFEYAELSPKIAIEMLTLPGQSLQMAKSSVNNGFRSLFNDGRTVVRYASTSLKDVGKDIVDTCKSVRNSYTTWLGKSTERILAEEQKQIEQNGKPYIDLRFEKFANSILNNIESAYQSSKDSISTAFAPSVAAMKSSFDRQASEIKSNSSYKKLMGIKQKEDAEAEAKAKEEEELHKYDVKPLEPDPVGLN